MSDELAKARAALADLGLPGDARLRRLGGLTNLVFEVAGERESWCLRLPGKGTEDYIDRRVEATNARAAAEAGVAPALIHAGADGVTVTRLIEDTVTMSPEGFRSIEGAVERAARALRQLHAEARGFEFRFELFAMIDQYLEVLAQRGAVLPDGYHQVVAESGAVREALTRHELPLTACHCDPLCENFLDDGRKMWIVDWEYSGVNDPMWDLGDLSVEGEFDPAMDERLLAAYFDGRIDDFDRGRMVIYKAMCDLLWTLWGLIQHTDGNPADDFWAYAIRRFERCRRLMDSPGFRDQLRAVHAGPGR
ncbi:MAG TPA: phosphotransferase [Geminicoccus sp.]|jgi:thiamine kinase-like enzyme|uniref:phosphotransferase n=1 Tax=Geminicoccus sp. TaxID=2024832 RepID=UPI002E303566|nr:phosphotransferase [Geminicoccus sp.]HEX2527747.1 phosphotransferase [Geminicoccus sp.]